MNKGLTKGLRVRIIILQFVALLGLVLGLVGLETVAAAAPPVERAPTARHSCSGRRSSCGRSAFEMRTSPRS